LGLSLGQPRGRQYRSLEFLGDRQEALACFGELYSVICADHEALRHRSFQRIEAAADG
jgi:hypothetical protein